MISTFKYPAQPAVASLVLVIAVPNQHAFSQRLAAQQPADTTPTQPKHHSKAKGAALGAVIGGAKGAAAGAAAGAYVQHRRNKKERERADTARP